MGKYIINDTRSADAGLHKLPSGEIAEYRRYKTAKAVAAQLVGPDCYVVLDADKLQCSIRLNKLQAEDILDCKCRRLRSWPAAAGERPQAELRSSNSATVTYVSVSACGRYAAVYRVGLLAWQYHELDYSGLWDKPLYVEILG